MSAARPHRAGRLPVLSIGRTLARILCALLALVGMLPFAAAGLVRSEPARAWAAAETGRLLRDLVGLEASYGVRIELLPLRLVVEELSVRASDGGSPALTTRRLSVTPRLFSLLAGRIDAGDVEIEEPRARLVVRDGELSNVAYRLPESKGETAPLERAPFSSLSLTDVRVDLEIDGVRVEAGPMDLDVLAEPDLAFEVALRVAESRVTRTRGVEPELATDEDILCELDTRIRVERGAALVRRLSLLGVADVDPAPGTRGSCKAADSHPGRTLVRLSEVRAVLGRDFAPTLVDGHVVARAPAAIANRFVPGPFRGWVSAALDVRWEASRELPEVRGKVKGGDIEMATFRFAKDFEAEVEISGDVIRAKTARATYGHADVAISGVTVRPLEEGIPFHVERTDSKGLRWEDLMENIDVTFDTILQWNLDKVVIDKFGGTLDPLRLDGDVYTESTGFEVFDRSYRSPARKHMVGVPEAKVRTRFGVRPKQVQFMNSRATFGSSEVLASVAVGFDNTIWLSVPEGSRIDLSDISPLVDIPMDGNAQVSVQMAGRAKDAELTGQLSVDGLVFAGFPLGDVESSKVRFKPLVVDLTDVRGTKGTTQFLIPAARLNFDTDATLLADARVTSDRLDLRDFLAMWHFDKDPRFSEIKGRGKVDAHLHYDMGGPKDRCGSGYLRVNGGLSLQTLDLFEEHYDSAESRFDFRWMDQEASHLGMYLDVPSLSLRKGSGAILGTLKMTDGARVSGHLVASGVPLARLDALGELGSAIDARIGAVAEVSGTLDALVANVDVRMGPARIGRSTLPASELQVHLAPITRPLRAVGRTPCGRPMPAEFDPAEYEADPAQGVFHTKGHLFGGQVHMEDLQVTRQRSKVVKGGVGFKKFDLGAMADLVPASTPSESRLDGSLTAAVDFEEFAMDRPGQATARIGIDELALERKGLRLELLRGARISVERRNLELSNVTLSTRVPSGERALFDVTGGARELGRSAKVEVSLTLRPTDLGAFARLLPQAERAKGTLAGSVRVAGTWPDLVQRGQLTLQGGELAFAGLPAPLLDVDVAIGIDPDEIRLLRGRASLGGGTLEVRGAVPFKGQVLGPGRVTVAAVGVNLPIVEGVRSVADADLALAWKPEPSDRAARELPKLTGDITLRSFRYTRKVTVAADLDSLTRRGRRTQFESYDPENDLLDIDVRVRSAVPLELDNDLVEAKLAIDRSGLVLSGTNQRFGMRGEVAVLKGGRIKLRRNEFEITQGSVRFDDPERIAPRVDVTAVTDYHRYDDVSSQSTSGAGSGSGATAGSGADLGGGRWRITMHAHGDPDTLRVDLSSEPVLSQDDIFLLLTLGITRTELDRAQSATAGGSVALEALGRLTGADEAVQETIPVIDEFKLGSAYSSRTGRTEPTVTIGKRLAQRVRAYVTSGLTESSEVRSNLEWRLSPRVSVEGSYDNVNDISTTGVGNLGADVRWRLEFE